MHDEARDWTLPDAWPIPADDDSWESVGADFEERGLGDGLPVVPPTRRRLGVMLGGVAQPDRSFGLVPPLLGQLTPARVAYCCVLAGCVPAELPVVFTALAACLDPAFNLLGVQTTTGSASVAVVVHGPIAIELGVNSAANCLGQGRRANACIGRAVRLGLILIGGAHPGTGDMATVGQPAKYTFCLAENPDESGYPPFHVRRGLPSSTSAVTVMAPSGTIEVLPWRNGDRVEDVVEPLAFALHGARHAAIGSIPRDPIEQVFILPPELARFLRQQGCDHRGLADRVASILRDLAVALGPIDLLRFDVAKQVGPEMVHPIVAGGPGVKMCCVPLWGGGSRLVTRSLENSFA